MDNPRGSLSEARVRGFREKFLDSLCDDMVFGIVGQAGAGPSEIARQLSNVLQSSNEEDEVERPKYDVEIVKASNEIRDAFQITKDTDLDGPGELKAAVQLQNFGDQLRKEDSSDIAQRIVKSICNRRRSQKGIGKKNAWIIDSLRHPDEVFFLRAIYRENFYLVGVVCSNEEREARLKSKFFGSVPKELKDFTERDEGDAENSTGQQVAKAFQLADIFVDNTKKKTNSGSQNDRWCVPEDLRRFVDLVFEVEIISPTMEETAMHAAYGASMRSTCLSRQVGAALVDEEGRLLTTGCNDVPKAFGGLYGQGLARNSHR